MDKLSQGRVLLVGEGDFSFSLAFAKHLSGNKKVEIISSSLLSEEELAKIHGNGPENVGALHKQGVRVLFSVDATNLENNKDIDGKFDRIIFNFPHVGGKSNIKKNRQLVEDFFKSAVTVLALGGDICVSFCQGQGGTPADEPIRAWYNSWQSVTAATKCDLILQELWPFSAETYPEYRSAGFRSLNTSFYTGGGSLTYVFRRCEPFVPPPCPFNLSTGTIKVNDRLYSIESQYVAEKFNRRLDLIKSHPICLTTRHIQQAMSQTMKMPLKEIPEPCPIVTKYTPKHSTYSVSASDNDLQKDNLILRSTLLDHLEDKELLEDLESGCLHSLVGNVCRRPSRLDSSDLPVQHELLLVLRLDKAQLEETWSSIKLQITDVLQKVVGTEHQFLLTQDDSVSNDLLDPSVFTPQSLLSIEASYKTSVIPVTTACNQVSDTGPAEIPCKSDSKCVKTSRQLGCLAKSKDCILILFNLEATSMSKYRIPDARLLWSEEAAFLDQFLDLDATDPYIYQPVSLYPPLWRHDISLWESKDPGPSTSEDFNEQGVLDLIREVCGDTVLRVFLVNTWAEPVAGRVLRCYRVVYQSYDRALSRFMAHAFQNTIRDLIPAKLDIELG